MHFYKTQHVPGLIILRHGRADIMFCKGGTENCQIKNTVGEK